MLKTPKYAYLYVPHRRHGGKGLLVSPILAAYHDMEAESPDM